LLNIWELQAPAADPEAPVADALVEGLIDWRRTTVARIGLTAEEASALDHSLPSIVAAFILLQMANDRGILRGGMAPRDVATVSQAHELLREAHRQLRCSLLQRARSALGAFPDGAASALSNLGELLARYDLRAIDPDALGSAYEAFIGTAPAVARAKKQLQLFEELTIEDRRKHAGMYYTPRWIAAALVDAVFRHRKQQAEWDDIGQLRVVDPACGSGTFLWHAYQRMLLELAGPDAAQAHTAVSEREARHIANLCLHGWDIDRGALEFARLRLWASLLATTGDLGDLPQLVERDAVRIDAGEPWADVVLGNPPFVRSRLWPKGATRDLKRRYATLSGHFDIAVAFVELSVRLAKPGALLALVIPNRLLTAEYAVRLREYLAEHVDVLDIVDLRDQLGFAGSMAYAALLVAQKKRTGGPPHRRPPRAIIVSALWPKSVRLVSRALSTGARRSAPAHGVQSAVLRVGGSGGPWIALTRAEQATLRLMERTAEPLDEVASRAGWHVSQGARTAADDVFVLSPAAAESRRGPTRNVRSRALGSLVELEAGALKPLFRPREPRAYTVGDEEASDFVLVPYLRGRLLSEQDLAERWPLAYDYLRQCRSRLESRRTRGPADWYDLAWIPGPLLQGQRSKLLTPDLVPGPVWREDAAGALWLTSGSMVVVRDDLQRRALLAILNSALMDWYLRAAGVPYRGGYVGLHTKYVRRLPLPTGLPEHHRALSALASLIDPLLRPQPEGIEAQYAQQRDVDREVFQLYGLDATARHAILAARTHRLTT